MSNTNGNGSPRGRSRSFTSRHFPQVRDAGAQDDSAAAAARNPKLRRHRGGPSRSRPRPLPASRPSWPRCHSRRAPVMTIGPSRTRGPRPEPSSRLAAPAPAPPRLPTRIWAIFVDNYFQLLHARPTAPVDLALPHHHASVRALPVALAATLSPPAGHASASGPPREQGFRPLHVARQHGPPADRSPRPTVERWAGWLSHSGLALGSRNRELGGAGLPGRSHRGVDRRYFSAGALRAPRWSAPPSAATAPRHAPALRHDDFKQIQRRASAMPPATRSSESPPASMQAVVRPATSSPASAATKLPSSSGNEEPPATNSHHPDDVRETPPYDSRRPFTAPFSATARPAREVAVSGGWPASPGTDAIAGGSPRAGPTPRADAVESAKARTRSRSARTQRRDWCRRSRKGGAFYCVAMAGPVFRIGVG